MTNQKRFQVDLTDDELGSIDRLGTMTDLKTKKEVILNALTLFRWAVKETMLGKVVCSLDEETNSMRQLELPALTAVSDKRPEKLSKEEVQRRLSGPMRTWSEFTPTNGVPSVASVLDQTSGRSVAPSVDQRPAK